MQFMIISNYVVNNALRKIDYCRWLVNSLRKRVGFPDIGVVQIMGRNF